MFTLLSIKIIISIKSNYLWIFKNDKHVFRVIFMKKLFIKFLKIEYYKKKSWFCIVRIISLEEERIVRDTTRPRLRGNCIVENIFRSLSCYVAANQVLTAKLLPNDENDSRLMSQTHSRRSRKHCNHYFLRAQRLSSIQWSNVLVNSLECWKYYITTNIYSCFNIIITIII